MAGNPYIPDDDIPTSEAAGRALAAAAPQPSPEAPLAPIPVKPGASSNTMGTPASFTPAPGANPYIPEGPQEQIQLSGESAEEPELRMERHRRLPDLWSAPAASPFRSMEGFTAFATNSSADDVEKILVKANPGTTVEHDNGARIYTFPGDPQRYSWVPGMQPSDIARAVPGVVGSIGAGMAIGGSAPLSVPAAIVANVVQSLLGEGAKAAAGADFSKTNVGIAALAPPIAAGIGGLVGGAGRMAGRILGNATATKGQAVESVVDPLVQKGKDLMVKFGAKPDLSELAQEVAGVTGPAAQAAQSAASRATTDAEAVAAGAVAKAEAETLTAQTAAKDAIGAARTTAQDEAARVANQLQDGVAAAGAKAEAEKTAASAPVNSVVDGTVQALHTWGAGETSSLDKKFLNYSMGVLEKLEKTAADLYKRMEEGFPKDARIQPSNAFQALQEWLDSKLTGRNPPKLLQRIKADTALEEVGNAVRMPQVIDITRTKQLASKVGHGGVAEFADMNAGDAKFVAGLLEKVEDQAARDHGMGEVLDKAQAAWTQRQSYRDELDKVLALRGERALRDGTLVHTLDAAGSRVSKGDLLPLKQIMNAAPPGMKQELMANIVNRTIDPSKGPEHMVAAIDAIRKSPEANELVFSNLPAGARKQLLSLGADMERALAKREADITAAEAAKKAETVALRRAAAAEKRGIRDTKLAETRTVRETEAAALRKIGQEKADTVIAAKTREQAAKEAAAQAEKLDIPLASRLKTAGRAILDGDVRPYEEMLKSAPGRGRELAMSTLYHTLVDPSDKGPEALKRMTEGLAKLEANPTARKLLLSNVPGAESNIRAVTKLMKEVYSGTAAGGKRAEGMLSTLANMGPWAATKAAGTAGAIAAGIAGASFPVASAVGLGAGIFGRILQSKFAKDPTIETKAANAFLASEVGRGLLKRFKLDKPVTQGYLNHMANHPATRAAARVYGMRPEQFIRKLAQGSGHVLREAGEQALAPNDTKDE